MEKNQSTVNFHQMMKNLKFKGKSKEIKERIGFCKEKSKSFFFVREIKKTGEDYE